MHVCRHRRHASRSDKPSGKYKPPGEKKIEKKDTAKMKKVTYGAADSKGDKKSHLKTEEVDGGGRGKISSLEQFEFLIEYSAVCRKTSPIGMMVTLRCAAVAQLKDKPHLSRKVKTSKASKKPKPKREQTS